jgi:Major Facilitator Superfamily
MRGSSCSDRVDEVRVGLRNDVEPGRRTVEAATFRVVTGSRLSATVNQNAVHAQISGRKLRLLRPPPCDISWMWNPVRVAGSGDDAGNTGRAAHAGPIDPATWLALAGMAAAIFVVANDFTAPSVALPAIERSFHIDVSTVQWTVNAYALWFGVLTVTDGRLADLLGRRRVFIAGACVFAFFSVVSALAQPS